MTTEKSAGTKGSCWNCQILSPPQLGKQTFLLHHGFPWKTGFGNAMLYLRINTPIYILRLIFVAVVKDSSGTKLGVWFGTAWQYALYRLITMRAHPLQSWNQSSHLKHKMGSTVEDLGTAPNPAADPSNTKHTAALRNANPVWLKLKNCFCLLVCFVLPFFFFKKNGMCVFYVWCICCTCNIWVYVV